MVSLSIFGIVMAGALAVVWTCLQRWYRTEITMRVSQANSLAIERIVYGAEGRGGLREADAATVTAGTNGWTLTYKDAADTTRIYEYMRAQGTITQKPSGPTVCRGVVFASAVTNTAATGVGLRVDVLSTDGRFNSSNSMSTFVEFRNRRGV
jgi:hypothetical protein